MKPEHFIYKSDGLYYMQNVPEYPAAANQFDPHDSVYFADVYTKALERAKSEAVKVEWAGCETIARLILLKYGETKEGEIYTINMEEKIEVITACDCEISRLQGTPRMCFMCSGKRNIARIAAPKNEPDHECTMDLMTDVCVYSCECGKIEVASNLSYHDKPKTYIPESAPKKEDESEQNMWEEVYSILQRGPSIDYGTLLKHFEIKRKPL